MAEDGIVVTAETEESFSLYVVDPDSGERLRLMDLTTKEMAPEAAWLDLLGQAVWSPDRKMLVYTCTHPGASDICTLDLETGDVEELTRSDDSDTFPDWSSDGERIAFQSAPGGSDYEIFVRDADGTNVRQVTDNDAEDGYARWAPDDTVLTFQSDREGNWDIFSMSPRGTAVTNLTQTKRDETFPAWAPDGGRIAFSAGGEDADIWMIDPRGRYVQLTRSPEIEYYPTFSPDGSRIAYARFSETQPDGELFVAPAAASKAPVEGVPIGRWEGFVMQPDW